MTEYLDGLDVEEFEDDQGIEKGSQSDPPVIPTESKGIERTTNSDPQKPKPEKKREKKMDKGDQKDNTHRSSNDSPKKKVTRGSQRAAKDADQVLKNHISDLLEYYNLLSPKQLIRVLIAKEHRAIGGNLR
jgi:hypothetical protein